MGHDYRLWVATDGEVVISIDSPAARVRRGLRLAFAYLPSGEQFTLDEAKEVVTLICNRSREDGTTMFLNGGEIMDSGPWSEKRRMELLDRFCSEVCITGGRVKARTKMAEVA
jgi:hypothetical protein